jgi:hypothetical protein
MSPGLSESDKHLLIPSSRVVSAIAAQDMLGDDGVLMMPTAPHPAPFHKQSYFSPVLMSYTGVFNAIGVPVTQVPLAPKSPSTAQRQQKQGRKNAAINKPPLGLQVNEPKLRAIANVKKKYTKKT